MIFLLVFYPVYLMSKSLALAIVAGFFVNAFIVDDGDLLLFFQEWRANKRARDFWKKGPTPPAPPALPNKRFRVKIEAPPRDPFGRFRPRVPSLDDPHTQEELARAQEELERELHTKRRSKKG